MFIKRKKKQCTTVTSQGFWIRLHIWNKEQGKNKERTRKAKKEKRWCTKEYSSVTQLESKQTLKSWLLKVGLWVVCRPYCDFVFRYTYSIYYWCLRIKSNDLPVWFFQHQPCSKTFTMGPTCIHTLRKNNPLILRISILLSIFYIYIYIYIYIYTFYFTFLWYLLRICLYYIKNKCLV